MDFELNEEQLLLRKTVREFAEAELAPHSREWDEKQEFPREVFGRLGELGLAGLLLEGEGPRRRRCLPEVVELVPLQRVLAHVALVDRDQARRRLEDVPLLVARVRHVDGRLHDVGHAPAAEHEILYRFEFPERPGALMRFLDSMSAGWNISLFHYRNHGADYGRVLVGMQVPPRDSGKFRRFLDRLGYDYIDESANPAYRMFLGR